MAQVSDFSAVFELAQNFNKFNTLKFWRSSLQAMQMTTNSTKGNDTKCLDTFDGFDNFYKEAVAKSQNRTAYDEAQKEKGTGAGSTIGFYIANGQRYLDVGVYAVNIFNYCQLNYYLVSFGKSFGTASGAVNTGITLFWRVIGTEDMQIYYDLSSAIIENDEEKAGKNFGLFASRLFQVEIPETTESQEAQETG